jgi:PKD repeat protein
LIGALATLLALLAPASPAAAEPALLAQDSFVRDVARGWGTADVGGDWLLDSVTGASVDGANGVLEVPAGRSRVASMPTVVTGSQTAMATFTVPALPPAGSSLTTGVVLQRQGLSYGLANVRVTDRGNLFLAIAAVSEPFFDHPLAVEEPVGRINAGGSFVVKAFSPGGSAGLIQAKAWTPGTPEPAWQLAAASSSIPASGQTGVKATSTAPTSQTLLVGSFSVSGADPTLPEPVPPVAKFSKEVEGKELRTNAAASFSPNGGAIANYAWDFGDGQRNTGQRVTHRFQRAGTFVVELTVTDTQGLSSSTTTSVTVAQQSLKPDSSNTGVPAGTNLRVLTAGNRPNPADTFNGDGSQFTINTAGAVYDGWRFNAWVQVRAPGVVFRNCFFAGSMIRPTASQALLLVRDDRPANGPVPSASVSDSTFNPDNVTPFVDGVRGSNFLLQRVEITNSVDGVHIFGSPSFNDPYAGNVVIQDSWIHDLRRFTLAEGGMGSDGSHNDGIQIVGGQNITVERTRIDGAIWVAAAMITQQRNRTGNITFADSWLGSGSCTINIYDGSGANQPIAGVTLVRNQFFRGTTRIADCAVIITNRTRELTTFASNVWTDGSSPAPTIRNGGRALSDPEAFYWYEPYERFVSDDEVVEPVPAMAPDEAPQAPAPQDTPAPQDAPAAEQPAARTEEAPAPTEPAPAAPEPTEEAAADTAAAASESPSAPASPPAASEGAPEPKRSEPAPDSP